MAAPNGDPIHQLLAPKRMARLDRVGVWRPFQYRIQAFQEGFQDILQRTFPAQSLGTNDASGGSFSLHKVKQYLWHHRWIARYNEDGRKAKSRGNNIWRIEARRRKPEEVLAAANTPSEGLWDFRSFCRRIAAAPSRATVGVEWIWPLHIWDPQLPSGDIRSVYRTLTLPPWLQMRGDLDNPALAGTPPSTDAPNKIEVVGYYLFGGTLNRVQTMVSVQIEQPEPAMPPIAPSVLAAYARDTPASTAPAPIPLAPAFLDGMPATNLGLAPDADWDVVMDGDPCGKQTTFPAWGRELAQEQMPFSTPQSVNEGVGMSGLTTSHTPYLDMNSQQQPQTHKLPTTGSVHNQVHGQAETHASSASSHNHPHTLHTPGQSSFLFPQEGGIFSTSPGSTEELPSQTGHSTQFFQSASAHRSTTVAHTGNGPHSELQGQIHNTAPSHLAPASAPAISVAGAHGVQQAQAADMLATVEAHQQGRANALPLTLPHSRHHHLPNSETMGSSPPPPHHPTSLPASQFQAPPLSQPQFQAPPQP